MSLLRMGVIPLFLVAIVGHVTCHYHYHVFDLTHTQSSDTLYWLGNQTYNVTSLSRASNSTGYWYTSNAYIAAEHSDIHLDHPDDFAKEHSDIHLDHPDDVSKEVKPKQHNVIPMKHLIGPGVIINVKKKVMNNPDYRVTVDDLKAWESNYKKIPAGAVVLMNSGWATNYRNKALTFGTKTPADPSTFHFPGWHKDAVDWLINNRHIHVVGVDTPSTDYGRSMTFPVHIALGTANIPGIANVAKLDYIPASGANVYVAVIMLQNGHSVRLFATYIEGSTTETNAVTSYFPSTVFLTVMTAVLLSF